MNLALIVLVVAVVTSLFVRRSTPQLTPRRPVRLVVATRVDRGSWRVVARRWLERATHGVEIRLLVETDEDLRVDSTLRGVVRVERGIPSRETPHPRRSHARVARKLLDDVELPVVIVDARATPVWGWDDILLRLLPHTPETGIVSAPTASVAGVARFPTLRQASDGERAKRDDPVEFPPVQPAIAPSVSWCAELSFATSPEPLRALDGRAKHYAQADVYVPTVALLEHDAALEEAILDEDEGHTKRVVKSEGVGLTADADDAERILKYGSVAKALARVASSAPP